MKKDNLKKWIEALEGEEYEQTTGSLKDDKGYCCLGVVCDIYGKEAGIENPWVIDPDYPEEDEDYLFFEDKEGNRHALELTEDVYRWLFNIPQNEPVKDVSIKVHLAPELLDGPQRQQDGKVDVVYLNDVKNYNFKRIAELLRMEFLNDHEDNHEGENNETK